jgi:hypothetical protein
MTDEEFIRQVIRAVDDMIVENQREIGALESAHVDAVIRASGGVPPEPEVDA